MSRFEHFSLGSADPEIVRSREEYVKGTPWGASLPPVDFSTVYRHKGEIAKMADAYDRLPDFDPRAVPAFKALRDETARQFDHMTKPVSKGGRGLSVDVTEGDPYHNAAEMMADIRNNNHLAALSTASTGGHPLLTNDENDTFRLVHDYYGHAGTGRGFDQSGEEAAYLSHARMFSPLARRALATETRGQNAVFGARKEFAPQKVALLPRQFAGTVPLLGDPRTAGPSIEAAIRTHTKAFG